MFGVLKGTHVQDILLPARTELPQYSLSKSQLSPSEIWFLLEFRGSNSFIRAYIGWISGWTGTWPGRFRLHH